MQYDLTNLQKKNERRLPAVAKSFLYESKRNFWSYTMKFQIRHSINRCSFSPTENRPYNFSMRGNYFSYVATLGINGFLRL